MCRRIVPAILQVTLLSHVRLRPRLFGALAAGPSVALGSLGAAEMHVGPPPAEMQNISSRI
eukprot:6853497-Pyramimonas_sp.AAC.1